LFGKPTEIIQHVLKVEYSFLLPEYIKLISGSVFLHAFAHSDANAAF